jgi:hypothetical protein
MQLHSAMRAIHTVLSRNDGNIHVDLWFQRFYLEGCSRQDLVYDGYLFARVDVIAICFDRSKRKTFQNAIYKVSI